MKKRIYINTISLAFIIAFLFSSCINNTNGDASIEEKVDTCIYGKLNKYVKEYIKETDYKFLPDIKPFYSIYFFNNEKQKYFTIWAFYNFPDYIETQNPNTSFTYCGFQISGRDIIFIHEKGFNIDRQLYIACKKNIKYAKKLKLQGPLDINYDGSWYPQTYSYNISGVNIVISKSDTLMADFLGKDFLEFEKYLEEE